jgi:hypothetical protein
VSIPLPVLDALNSITIPNHCSVPWEGMEGDNRTRYCRQCDQPVHDLSELSAEEAVELLSAGGRTCARLYRRPDGRVMTADCMTGRERAWKWLSRRSALAGSLFALVFLSGCRTATQGMIPPSEEEAMKVAPPKVATPATPVPPAQPSP